MTDALKGEFEELEPPEPLTFRYKNHRGVTRDRKVMPMRLAYGRSPYHPKPGWFLVADDFDEEEIKAKHFPLSEMLRPATGAAPEGVA